MTFETSIDKINMCIHAVYVLEGSDLGLRIWSTECIMSASSVNTALQNSGNSNQSALFTFKLHPSPLRNGTVSVVVQTRTNMRYPFEVFLVSLSISVR